MAATLAAVLVAPSRRAVLGVVVLAGCPSRAPEVSASAEPPSSSSAPSSVASAAPSVSAPPPAHPAPPPSAAPPPSVGVVVTATTYRFTAPVHANVPPITFELTGTLEAVGARVRVSASVPRDIPDTTGLPCIPRCAERELGPGTIEVTDAAGRRQSLKRGYPKQGPDDWDAEPQALELSTKPVFGKNVGAGDLALADYDGDGYLDLEVPLGRINDGRGHVHLYKQVWLFEPKSGDFQELMAVRRYELSLQSPGCLTSFTLRGGPSLGVYELQRRTLVHVATAETGYDPAEPRRWSFEKAGSRCVKMRPGDTVEAP